MDIEEEIVYLREENERLKDLLKVEETISSDMNSLKDLVDVKKLEDIFARFTRITGYPTGLISEENHEILASSGFNDICQNFHKNSETSLKVCTTSSKILAKDLTEFKTARLNKCDHGMMDGATPIIIDGKHLANIFTGQVLCERPDVDFFKENAQEYGYDEEEYLKALENVKVVSEKKLEDVLDFLAAIAGMITQMGKDKKAYIELNATLEHKVEERVKEQNSLLSLFDKSDNVLFKWNNDEDWSVSFVSKSVAKLLGYTKDEFENDSVTFASCIHPEDISTVMKEVKTHTAENNNFFTHRPYRIITKDGEVKWVLDNTVLIRDDDNKITHYLGYLSDVTIFKEHENKLEYLSITDQLTKVHNRLHTDEVLQTQYYRHFRNNEECGVILIDIDYFKSINDTFGHIVGDLFLVEFANLLQMNVRESDIIGRWGGEEFLIILPHTNLDATCISANKLKEIIEKNDFSKVGHKTASFGVSSFGIGVSVEQVIENADKALYTSKENGRNQVTC